ncbi:MAG: hypothetical protein J6C64_00695 [Lachnospiraceae bacterium]|nr:hypothetical protein [Lachnospiraceae bacterium]
MDLGKEILKSIQLMIDKRISTCKYDKTFTSVIRQINSNGTYIVLDDAGGERNAKCCIPGIVLRVGQTVWVKIPMNDLKKIHICGIL